MAEDKKPDLSSLPRGAIGIKGLPVNRNTRLPSIRSPRDLTLGALPKKTYVPNIPVRREKKQPLCESSVVPKQESGVKKNNEERGGRGRQRKQIIQTQGALFSEGIAQDPLTRKEKLREAYQRSDLSSPRGISLKKEKNEELGRVSRRMEHLLRDDFIDDGDADEWTSLKPTIFPKTEDVKKETKSQAANFNQNIAKEMGFDVQQVAKFIKKEKEETEETQSVTPHPVSSTLKTSNNIQDILRGDADSSRLVLLQFPELKHKREDSENQDGSVKSLPEGYVGKLRVMKSGKTKLLLGGVELCLDNVHSLPAQHQVVSLTTQDISVLGYLTHKAKFAPDVDILIPQ